MGNVNKIYDDWGTWQSGVNTLSLGTVTTTSGTVSVTVGPGQQWYTGTSGWAGISYISGASAGLYQYDGNGVIHEDWDGVKKDLYEKLKRLYSK